MNESNIDWLLSGVYFLPPIVAAFYIFVGKTKVGYLLGLLVLVIAALSPSLWSASPECLENLFRCDADNFSKVLIPIFVAYLAGLFTVATIVIDRGRTRILKAPKQLSIVGRGLISIWMGIALAPLAILYVNNILFDQLDDASIAYIAFGFFYILTSIIGATAGSWIVKLSQSRETHALEDAH
jgi:hypothetical protein